jgi:hypothetical protein
VSQTPTTSTTVGRKTVTTTKGHEEVIKKAGTAMSAEKQDISGKIVQSDEMGAEMVTEMGAEMGVEMEAGMEMETDSTAKVKAMELVPEMEADSTAMVMEPVLEMEADSTDKAKVMESVLEMEADSTVKASEEILDQEVKDPVKQRDTIDGSCVAMAPTIRNDSRGRLPSIRW